MLDTQGSLSIVLETNMAPSSCNDHFILSRTTLTVLAREDVLGRVFTQAEYSDSVVYLQRILGTQPHQNSYGQNIEMTF